MSNHQGTYTLQVSDRLRAGTEKSADFLLLIGVRPLVKKNLPALRTAYRLQFIWTKYQRIRGNLGN